MFRSLVLFISVFASSQEIQYEWKNPHPFGLDITDIYYYENSTILNGTYQFDTQTNLNINLNHTPNEDFTKIVYDSANTIYYSIKDNKKNTRRREP